MPQSPAERAAEFMLYHAVAVPLVFLLQKICYGEKIVNRQALKPYLNSGCFLYGNHTRGAGDAFCPAETAFPRKPYIVTSPDAVALPLIRGFVKALGGLPVPDSLHGLRQFRKTVDGLAEKGISLEMTDAAKNVVLDNSYKKEYGARPMRRYIESHIEDALAQKLIRGELKSGDTAVVSESDGKLKIEIK